MVTQSLTRTWFTSRQASSIVSKQLEFHKISEKSHVSQTHQAL